MPCIIWENKNTTTILTEYLVYIALRRTIQIAPTHRSLHPPGLPLSVLVIGIDVSHGKKVGLLFVCV
jgi:hypothetical protein